jgi:hypothetical protein
LHNAPSRTWIAGQSGLSPLPPNLAYPHCCRIVRSGVLVDKLCQSLSVQLNAGAAMTRGGSGSAVRRVFVYLGLGFGLSVVGWSGLMAASDYSMIHADECINYALGTTGCRLMYLFWYLSFALCLAGGALFGVGLIVASICGARVGARCLRETARRP